MKAHPILFSAPMVRAILAGTKTQTRRALAPRGLGFVECCCGGTAARWMAEGDRWHCGTCGGGARLTHNDVEYLRCPYGQPGDRLWVRETWNSFDGWAGYYYAADYDGWGIGPDDDPDHVPDHAVRWKPSIHMPRAASRITLEITSVRVERLQEIWENDADCIAEGIEEMPPHPCGTKRWRNYQPGHPQAWSPNLVTPGNSFSTLWRLINGDESWDANPWVWAITFKRIESTT